MVEQNGSQIEHNRVFIVMIDEAGISEKEFEVIRSLEENSHYNQRLIAKEAGISLGLTNLILKKMIKKGYLKARQLTPKKIQYILTPKGILEKAKKSYWFTKRTINTMRGMKQRIQEAILKEYEQGNKKFAIKGKGELADLVEIAMRDLSLGDVALARLADDSVQNDNEYTLIIADDDSNVNIKSKNSNNMSKPNRRVINILELLAQ
ncbi:MAG: winged helix-turn-helix transcriptional regulator [Planctomycetes bacterium]|nr:winged helix-turn-helix transcriptional regulator [Planctomycetota bacterium]